MTQKRNWYTQKTGNKRALSNRARRREKYQQQEEELTEQGAISSQQKSEQAPPPVSVSALLGIVGEVQKFYVVIFFDGRYIRCYPSNKRNLVEQEKLVIGDKVLFEITENDTGVVLQALPRQTKLARMRQDSTRRSEFSKEEHILAANVDVVVIVASAKSPPFHPRLVDRYLVMCQYGEVPTVICINKSDLTTELPDLGIYQRMQIPIVFTSVMEGRGLTELQQHLQGKISVLTGQSGVGKSSIINALLGREVLRVGAVGGWRGMGRHTTSISTLHRLDDASFLIDTPGIRSLGLWEIDKQTLRFYFPEFEPYAPACRFRDCVHMSEPDCAVKDAVKLQEISPQRYASYVRMMND